MTSSPGNQTIEKGSLARDTVGTTLTNVALFILGIFIWVIIARLLGPVWRGELALVMLAPAIVMKTGSFGYDQGMIVLGGKNRTSLGPLTGTGVLLGFFMGVLFIGLLLGFMWGFPKTFWNISQVWLPGPFMIISMAFPLHLMTMAYDAAIYAEDRIAARNLKELVINIVMIVVILAAFFLFKLQLFGVIGAYIIANTVSLGYSYLLVRGRIPLPGTIDINIIRQAVRLGFPIYLAQLAAYMMLPVMMILLSFSLAGSHGENLARIAFFTMAYQMIERILPVTRSVAFALLPKITGGSDTDASELTAKASRQTFLTSLLLFIILAIFMKPIVDILLGSRFIPVAGAFAIMAAGGIALSMAGVWSAHLLARTRPYEVAKAGIIGVLVALVIAWAGFQNTTGREVQIASVAVLIGSFVNAGFLLNSFCKAGSIKAVNVLIPTMADMREWRRIPGFITEMIGRRHRN